MDGSRFDAAIRRLGESSRRSMLWWGAILGSGLMALPAFSEVEAKKKKRKKCKKCLPPCRKCKKGKCKATGEGTACGPCSRCQGGVCTSLCTAGELCLANESCGKICDNFGQCENETTDCSCNEDNGGDPVCRVSVGMPPSQQCAPLADCTTTADCPPETVCSTICQPTSKCVPLCPVAA